MDEHWDLAGLRQRSELLFGSAHRLPTAVMAVTAKEGELFAAAIGQRAGIHRKDAGRILDDWKAANLLELAPLPQRARKRGGQPEYLRCREDTFWICMQELADRYRRAIPRT